MIATFVRRSALALAAALAAATTLLPAQGAERGPVRRAVVDEAPAKARVIVKYRAEGSLMRGLAASDRASPRQAALMAQRHGVTLRDGRIVGPRTQVLHGRGLSSAALAARLARDPDVEYAEVDQRVTIQAGVPNDPLYRGGQTTATPEVGQWYLRAPDATVLSAINAEGAWLTTAGSDKIVVAVLDTGVRLDHPDLVGKLLPGYDFVSADSDGSFGTAGDGDGRDPDASDPGDFVAAGECGSGDPAASSSWHGTQVAGLIGASTDNGVGMAGSGRNVKVLPVRVLGKCGGYQSDIAAGMRWAAGLSASPTLNPNPARVINLSLGSSGTCSATYRDAVNALTAAGVAVVVAAGNDAGLAANQPANCTGAIGVAGIRHIGTKVGYSNVGATLAVAAPAGNCVNVGNDEPCLYPLLTTTNLGNTTPGLNSYSDSYNISVGTSFATPLVAGTVALMLSANPALTPAQITATLKSTARSFPTTGADAGTPACRAPSSIEQDECYCTTSTCGAGMLDASNAVLRASQLVVPTATIAVATTTIEAGSLLTLDGRASVANGGRTIASYAWSLVQGSDIAQLSGATNGPTASLATSGGGLVVAALTITDSAGASTTGTVAVQVTGDAGGGGGGATGAGWLAGLALAVAVLAVRRRAQAVRASGRA